MPMKKTFTLELNALIKEAFQNYALSEKDPNFFSFALFNELKAGDFVLFPFNPRAGIYIVDDLKTQPAPLTDDPVLCKKMICRNHSGSYLVPDERNLGVWLLKVDPTLVDWELWNDMESTISMNLLEGSKLNTQETDGFSNWYDWEKWPELLPLDLFKSLPKDDYEKIKTYYPS